MAVAPPTSSTQLPYRRDSAEWFAALAGRPWAMFLDSAGRGRFDILVSDPVATVVTRGGTTRLEEGGIHSRTPGRQTPMEALRCALDRYRSGIPSVEGIPFTGGALGYFAYDLGWSLGEWPGHAPRPDPFPEMAVGIYRWALVVDHTARATYLVNPDLVPPGVRQALERPPAPAGRFSTAKPVVANLTEERYRSRLAAIRDYLREGDVYQVNFAQCFQGVIEGDPWALYRELRDANPAPFSAYLDTPFGQVLSASPERFLRVRDGGVETRPIKGTRPRDTDPRRDAELAEELRASVKDRAENVMIVDLLRNDLGRVCEVGSVEVPDLFAVESFASVHHLVSTVRGRLAPARDPLHLLAACFPGGSITGAPKRRAMEIIDELEPEPRGIYCGSIGYIGFDGAMDSSIAIRTLTHRKGEVRFCAGGGVVIDSDPAAEYRETLDKVAPFIRLLGGFDPR